jgi:hypothetical protein
LKLTRAIRLLSIGFLLWPAFLMPESSGSICLAPVPHPVDGRRGSGPETVVCDTDKYSVKIDSRKPIALPMKESVQVTGLDLAGRHRVVVFCANKPVQTFTFRFSEFPEKKLCLFFNDLYWTVQLWADKRCPWCKCK